MFELRTTAADSAAQIPGSTPRAKLGFIAVMHELVRLCPGEGFLSPGVSCWNLVTSGDHPFSQREDDPILLL